MKTKFDRKPRLTKTVVHVTHLNIKKLKYKGVIYLFIYLFIYLKTK